MFKNLENNTLLILNNDDQERPVPVDGNVLFHILHYILQDITKINHFSSSKQKWANKVPEHTLFSDQRAHGHTNEHKCICY